MTNPFLHILLLGLLLGGTFGAFNKPGNPVQWSLAVAPKPYSAGGKFTAQLTAQIEKGWHLYALEEVPNGPRPTRITLVTPQPFALSGDIATPKPHVKFDENFGVETQFHETSVTFRLPIKVTPKAKSGKTALAVQTRYQVCNEEMCLPPKTVKVIAVVTIK